MRMQPGIAGQDLELFGSSINAVQLLGFKKVELSLQATPGERSSRGATGSRGSRGRPEFIRPHGICNRGYRHECNRQAAQSFMKESGGGTTLITRARNSGAVVRVA